MNVPWNRNLEVAFASLYIGDSQTMAAEAGVLSLGLWLNTMKGHLSEEFSPCHTLSPKIGNCLGTP